MMTSSSPKFDVHQANSILIDHVKKAYQNELFVESWRNLPEVPTGEEIMPNIVGSDINSTVEAWNEYQQEPVYDPSLPHNIIDGPWPSKEEYIAAHYQINRKDAIASLQASVAAFKRCPGMMEDRETAIYTHVTFKGITLSRIGTAFRIEFSNERADKQIRWEQSKRLVAGTIVALTPHTDLFRSVCKVGVVAARPIEGGLDQNPPQIDIFWGDPDDAVFDPVEKYVMVEARSGYFEASRHMLVAMQKLMTERFTLADHIVSLNPDIEAPDFVNRHPWMNLNSLIREDIQAEERLKGIIHDGEEIDSIDILQEWPHIPHTGMDLSQKQACQAMLTRKISIIQGPPGTGKTFVSVAALQVMLDNWIEGDPPIIVSAQTNHALDQLLTHIMVKEPNIARLGGRCDPENTAILERTLYNLRMQAQNNAQGNRPPNDSAFRQSKAEFDARAIEIKSALDHFLNKPGLTMEILAKYDILKQSQVDSLSEEGWASSDSTDDKLNIWLTPEQTLKIPGVPLKNFGLPLEEGDIEFEQLQELEENAGDAKESVDNGNLKGEYLSFTTRVTGKHAAFTDKSKLKKYLAKKDLYAIPIGNRGECYRYWEKKLHEKILIVLRGHLHKNAVACGNYQITKWMSNIKLIKHQGIKVIGCTTTGLSKYRGLLAALQPRTILIEEAAETLEGTIIACMFDSLEQLVLVGDHKQLQAHCNVRALEGAPYNLNVSMFERLVNNNIGYIMLNEQRRMISDVRQLLTLEGHAFYKDLYDHSSVFDRVKNRPPIPGMGGKDTYFFNHNWPEARNSDSSMYNKSEAEFIAGFFYHLIMNGVEQSKITVLTFYNGQRKTILKELKNYPGLVPSSYFHVHTIDSYQGEENDVILLSMVRSNQSMGIGFLENRNRAVVALSRARRGLYIFANAVTLTAGEQDEQYLGRPVLWSPIIQHMARQKRFDLDGGLPVTCANHNDTVAIYEPGEWIGRAGGCDKICGGILPCEHACTYTCHSFPHESVVCAKPCEKLVPSCGHKCAANCGQSCYCTPCLAKLKKFLDFQKQEYTPLDIDQQIRKEQLGNAMVHLKGNSRTVARGSTTVAQSAKVSSGAQAWQEWDAAASDQKQAEMVAQENAIEPPDFSKMVIAETYRPVAIKTDGQRKLVAKEVREVKESSDNVEVTLTSPMKDLISGVDKIELLVHERPEAGEDLISF